MNPYEALTETEWSEVERVHDLLEEGELEEARALLDRQLRRRPGHPDLRIADATLLLEEGEAGAALAALAGAERSADPAQYFYLRAAALHDLARFEEARTDAERALAIHDDMAVTHDLLSRTCEHLGDAGSAERHAAAAAALEPDGFPEPLELSDEDFDGLVERAVQELPPPIRRKLDELPVLVQPLPSREMLGTGSEALSPDLLGLFVGHHVFAHSVTLPPSAPGAIYLFRRNLLRACADRDELEREIRITVQHEVGHLLGLDEDDLDRWGLA